MKIVAIGDIHGRDIWKQIVDLEFNAYQIVFIGDYFDTLEDISPAQQLHNLKEILQLKQLYPHKFTLLLGNHDLHYLINERYSGFQIALEWDVKEFLTENLQFFNVCYRYNKYLFTHAGVTNTWCDNHYVDRDNLEYVLDTMLYTHPDYFGFVGSDMYGNSIESGPMWVRIPSLIKDGLSTYIHVVGHTQQENIIKYTYYSKNLGIICIDALPEYLIINFSRTLECEEIVKTI